MNEEQGGIFDIEALIDDLQNRGEYFIDFLKVRHLEAGLIVLKPGVQDTQTPHDSDELYYVVRGSGLLQLGKQSRPVGAGSIIFVPAKMEHRFHGNSSELVVLYVFAEE